MKFSSRITELGEQEVKKNWTERFIKEELQYCYKRGSSRFHLSTNINLKYMQSIFASRALRDLFSGKIFINVDGSSFTKSVKSDYLWLPRRETHPIVNTWGTGRAVVLFALISNGEWLWFVSKNTTDSKIFWNFIILLSNYIEQWMDFSSFEWELLLDNASIHLSAVTKHITKKLGLRMRFLPQYSPKLAPVELVFGMLKSKLRAKKSRQVVKYSMMNGRKEICNALSEFSKIKASRLWTIFIFEAKKVILEWRAARYMGLDEQVREEEYHNE